MAALAAASTPSTAARRLRLVLALFTTLAAATAHAGAQVEEALAASVQNSLHRSVSDYPAPHLEFATDVEGWAWLADMSSRLAAEGPHRATRRGFFINVQY